jgi:hypothetical protein
VVDDKMVEADDQDGVGRAGLGLRIRLTDRLGMRLEGRVQSSMAFASDWLALGERTGYSGPDFLGLASVFVNLGATRPKLWVEDKVVIKDPEIPDDDRDGMHNRADRCPKDPEDPDHFEDEDGCPRTTTTATACRRAGSLPGAGRDQERHRRSGRLPRDRRGRGQASSDRWTSARTRSRPTTASRTPTAAPTPCRKSPALHRPHPGHQLPQPIGDPDPQQLPAAGPGVEVLKQYPELKDRDQRPHRRARQGRLQPRAVAAAGGEGARVPARQGHRGRTASWAVGYGMDRPIASKPQRTGRSRTAGSSSGILTADAARPAHGRARNPGRADAERRSRKQRAAGWRQSRAPIEVQP